MRIAIGATICAAIIFIGADALRAQEPQNIERLTRRMMSHDWYVEQQKLWKGEVDKDPHNANAWLNYYKATRYAGFGDTTTDPKTRWDLTQKLIDDMGNAIPNTFEYHYAKWWAGGNTAELFPHLEKAFELKPDYAELSDDFISYYELQGNREKVAFFSRKWYATKDVSSSLLEYNYNVLMSLEKNAILVTSGDNDTYPIWLLQYAKGIRTDVTVLNLGLIAAQDYRRAMMREHGIKGDPGKLDEERLATVSWESAMGEFLKSIAEENDQRPVYFALTCEPEQFSAIRENLYTVGLANKYSRTRIDNIALLKRNWEKFRLDYLDYDFYSEDYPFNTSWLPMINMNYITPAMLLYEHYRLSGENDRAGSFRELALKIGREGGQEKEVEQYIARIDGQQESASQPEEALKSAKVELRESTLQGDVKIFPNPAFSLLTIQLPEALDADIQLVDVQGSTHRQIRTHDRQIELNIEGLAAGAYIVHISTAKGNISRTVRIAR
jgi:hypothetical protein